MAVIGVLILYAGALMCADGIRIKECSDSNWLEIREDNNPSTPITCDEFSANDTITWILSVSGAVTGNYTCGPSSQQCVSTDSDVTIRRTNHGTGGSSVLTVVGNHRTKAGKGVVSCRLAEQTPVAIDNCNINVVSRAIVRQCRITINREKWTASASCPYDSVYSSNGTYTCTWYRLSPGQSLRYRLLNVSLPTTNQTTTGGKQYYRGDCSLSSLELPVAEGTYVYTVDFVPGPDRHPAGSVTIQIPGNPQTNCTQYVHEGQDVQCYCQVNPTTPGSPAPVVKWEGLQPGESLNITNVSRHDTEGEFSCQLNWGKPNNKLWKTTKYSLQVAYGPDEVMITEDEGAQSPPPSSTLTLQCRAINVFPSATFTWSGAVCSSTTSHTTISTCTFPWTPGDDDKMITCTARNSQYPQQFYSETTETFSFEHPTTPPSVITSSATSSPASAKAGSSAAPGGDEGFPLGAVIGGAVAVVVLIIIVIIIVVIIVKRKRRKTPKDHDNESAKVVKTTNPDEFEEHTNPVYGTEEEEDRSSASNPKPSAVALRISADSSVPLSPPVPTTNPSSAAPVKQSSRTVSPEGLYSSVDGDDSAVPARNGLDVDEGLGGYAVVGDPDPQPPGTAGSGPDAPQGYIYSVVNKSKAKATASLPSNTTQPSDIPKEVENAYSVVDLSPTSPSPSSAQAEGSNNVYAQVNKNAKRDPSLHSDQPNTEAVSADLEGNEYTQDRKPKSSAKPETKAKPEAKPKPEIKPKPKPDGNAAAERRLEDEQHGGQPTSADYEVVEPTQQTVNPPKEVTQNASNDDDYNTLNLFPRSHQPKAEGPGDSTYSHISHFR